MSVIQAQSSYNKRGISWRYIDSIKYYEPDPKISPHVEHITRMVSLIIYQKTFLLFIFQTDCLQELLTQEAF